MGVLLISSTSSRILAKEPTLGEVGGCSPEDLQTRNSFSYFCRILLKYSAES